MLWRLFRRLFPRGKRARTKNGEAVRSRSERAIADYFASTGVRYIYEKPLCWGWFPFRKCIRPDFYLPGYDVYVEFWGLAGERGYDRQKRYKMKVYRKLGIRLVYPKDMHRPHKAFVRKMKKALYG